MKVKTKVFNVKAVVEMTNPPYNELIKTLVATGAIKATKYIAPNEIARAVRTRYGKSFSRGNLEITLTHGKPNFREREFIQKCQKAKEPFPVKKIQLQFMPK